LRLDICEFVDDIFWGWKLDEIIVEDSEAALLLSLSISAELQSKQK
jgi:hypothetical protein